MESDADRVMRAAISTLFRRRVGHRQLIKLKAVYELLETATDRCQDVANVIEGVVLRERLMRHGRSIRDAGAAGGARAGIRLHERLPRRRELDRHGGLDRVLKPYQAVAWAAFFNFVAIGSSSPRWRPRSARASSIRTSSTVRDLRRADRRDHLEPRHLVLRHSRRVPRMR
jgi:hypothetical protein